MLPQVVKAEAAAGVPEQEQAEAAAAAATGQRDNFRVKSVENHGTSSLHIVDLQGILDEHIVDLQGILDETSCLGVELRGISWKGMERYL